jgi:D-alanyl-D-alanine carboxypeptidase
MYSSPSARTAVRRRRSVLVVVLAILLAGIASAAIIGGQTAAVSSSAAALLAATGADPAPANGSSEGEVPDGVTVFDDAVPAVVNLDPDLLDALRRAARDASAEGITFYVNSGWRSAGYQDQLLDDAIAEYGSAAEAARWVATADASPHVTGDAIDIGQWDATTWLSEHGAEYGLCQIYANESWHYELRPEAVDGGCPAMYADPTDDPRMSE